ncbi:unnamed protein product [Phytophthora fragariaefolia]|uniref:Unnamed protein product n=1 Tax=Phytophthora fragariaefolia TaxID=1490495 RepID=A0A9W7CR04_9STRA|nr:unnamed protein product [Phytophthora fragariaefolia]
MPSTALIPPHAPISSVQTPPPQRGGQTLGTPPSTSSIATTTTSSPDEQPRIDASTELSGQKQLQIPQSTRYSFARTMKQFRRRLLWQLVAFKLPMSPEGLTKTIQQIVLTGVLAFEVFYIPFALSYLSNPKESAGYQRTAMNINIAVEILLVTDIALNFNTAFYDKPSKHSQLVTSRTRIIRRYLTGLFAADLPGSLPAECISSIAQEDGNARPLLDASPAVYIVCHVLRFLRLPELFRLLESSWMRAITAALKAKNEVWCGAFQPLFCTTAKLGIAVVTVAHYLTCLMRGLHLVDNYHLLAQSVSISTLYTTNLRQTMTGMFGGTKEGVKDSYCIFLVLTGLLMMALVVSIMSIAVMESYSANDKKHTLNSRVLTSRMDKLKLPQELKSRIQKYYGHMWSEYSALDGDMMEFTRKLPRPLALEVLLHRYLDLVSGFEFWADCSQDFLSALVLSMDVRIFAPDDYIVRKGDVGSELYMFYRGLVEQTGVKIWFGYLHAAVHLVRLHCCLTTNGIRVFELSPMLRAAFSVAEHPELWQQANEFAERGKIKATTTSQSDGNMRNSTDSGLFQRNIAWTHLSCSDAAEMLVDLMELVKDPWEKRNLSLLLKAPEDHHSGPEARSDQEYLPRSSKSSLNSDVFQKSSGEVSSEIPNAPAAAGGGQILQLLISLTKSGERAWIRVNYHDSSVACENSTLTATAQSKLETSLCKVQPRQSQFHRTASHPNPATVDATSLPIRIRSSSLSVGDRRSSVIADLSSLKEDGDNISSSDVSASYSKAPRKKQSRVA